MTPYRVFVRVNGLYLWSFEVWARNEHDARVCAKLSLATNTPNLKGVD